MKTQENDAKSISNKLNTDKEEMLIRVIALLHLGQNRPNDILKPDQEAERKGLMFRHYANPKSLGIVVFSPQYVVNALTNFFYQISLPEAGQMLEKIYNTGLAFKVWKEGVYYYGFMNGALIPG